MYPINTPKELEHPVDAPSIGGKGRRPTLIYQTDIEETDPTLEEFREMMQDPQRLHSEVVKVMHHHRDLGYRFQEAQTELHKVRAQLQRQSEEAAEQKAIISSLVAGQTQQGTPTSRVSFPH